MARGRLSSGENKAPERNRGGPGFGAQSRNNETENQMSPGGTGSDSGLIKPQVGNQNQTEETNTNTLSEITVTAERIPSTPPTGTNVEDIEQEDVENRLTRQRLQAQDQVETEQNPNVSKFLTFEDNELNKLETPTYHFRLSVTNELLVDDNEFIGGNIQNMPRVAVAETGASDFFIGEVEMQHTPEGSRGLRNQEDISFNITIVEPKSAEFMDRVFDASQAMGVSNWMDMPWILELWFIGKNPNGGFESTDKRTFIIKVSESKINIDKEGTKYEMKFAPKDHDAYQGNVNIIDFNFRTEAKTVGEFFNKLETALNESEKRKKGMTGPVPENEYQIILVDQDIPGIKDPMRNWKIVPDEPEYNSERAYEFNVFSRDAPPTVGNPGNTEDKKTVTFTKGIDIEKILENIVASTKEGAKAVSGSKDDKDTKQRDIEDPFKWFPVTKKRTIYKEFDQEAQSWSKKYVTYIFLKQDVESISDEEEVFKRDESKYQENRLRKLNRSGVLTKKFEYIYTGLNTEVLNFDLTFDHLWYVPKNWFDGTSKYENTTIPPLVNQKSQEQMNEEQRVNRLIRRFRQERRDRNPAPAGVGPQNRSEDGTLLRSEQINKNFLKESESRLGRPLTGEETERALETSEQSRERRERNVEETRRRLKERSSQPVISLSEIDESTGDFNRKLKLSINQSDYDPRADVSQNIEDDWKKSKSIFSSALHQIYGIHGKFAHISLEVKGDPYWLGLPDSEKINKDGSINLNKMVTRANYSSGSIMFMLVFGFPDRSENPRQIKSHEFASQVYSVSTITSTFSNGKFTQKIEAHMDTRTDMASIDKSIFRVR